MKKTLFLILFLTLLACSKEIEKRPDRINCGEIVRLWSYQSFEEGNPCANNDDYSRRLSFIVKNDFSGETKPFCVNNSEYNRYKLGSVYCDKEDPSGW